MASTHQISSERYLAHQSSAKVAVSSDSSAALDEFSRLVDSLVTLVARPKTGNDGITSFSVELGAQRQIVKEIQKPHEAAKESVALETDSKASSPEVIDAEDTKEAACEQKEAPPEESSEKSETDAPASATEVSVAASQVTTVNTSQQGSEVSEAVLPGAEIAQEQALLGQSTVQSAALATENTPTKVSIDHDAAAGKFAVPEATKVQIAVNKEISAESTGELSIGEQLAEALATKETSSEDKRQAGVRASMKSQLDVGASTLNQVRESISALSNESITGILLRHASQAVSKVLGIDRSDKIGATQQTQQNSNVLSLQSNSAAESGSRQPKLKALPRHAAVKLMERVEQTLQEMARSKDGKSVSLKLEPADLGMMRVDVSIRDGVLHARITPESKPVASFLQEKAHELQSMLRKLGLNVDSVTVSVRSEEFTVAQGEHNSQGTGKNDLSQDGQGGSSGNNFPSSQGSFSNAGSERSGGSVEDHWVA